MMAAADQTAASTTEAPWWARLLATQGLAVVLVLWAMGLIPGVASPFVQFIEDHKAVAGALEKHEATTKDKLRVDRLICRGVWRAEPNVQRQCDE